MTEEAVIERGDVPIARAASPLWKWAFIGTMVTLGAGTLAAVVLTELQGPAVPEVEEEHKPRLRFNVGSYEVPTFEQPVPAEPEPEPEPVIAQVPEPPFVPELPRPEPREGYGPMPYELPPPMPEPAAVEPVETPAEIARKRRLAAPLGGSGGGTSSPGRTEEGEDAGRDRGGIDLLLRLPLHWA